MPIKFTKPLSIVVKQEMILKTFELVENDCIRICTEKYNDGYGEYDLAKKNSIYKIIKQKDGNYVLKNIGGDHVVPLTYLINLPWVEIQQITKFGDCKCEDVSCKECPLFYVNHQCNYRYMERFNDCNSTEVFSYFPNVDIKAKRNASIYKDTVRQIYDHFINIEYPSKYRCLINWNAVYIELEKTVVAVEEEGVTYFKMNNAEYAKEEEME